MAPPTGGIDELSRTLRQLRLDAGLSGQQAGDRAGFSQAKVSRIEAGRTVPTPKDVRALARFYGAPAAEVRRLVGMAEAVQAATRRIVLSRHPNRAAFQERIGKIETASAQIREFSATFVPGLLQTDAYMSAIWATGDGNARDGEAFRAARRERQSVLADEAKQVTFIVMEGAFGLALGSPTEMIAQCESLISRINGGLRFGIIPFGCRAATLPSGSWALYDERAVIPSVLAVQTVLNAPEVAPYVAQWLALEPMAVFGDDARAILTRVAERYRSIT